MSHKCYSKYMLTSVAAFIVKDGRVLIAQRASDEEYLANHWELVGGGVEPNETPEEAVVREAREESGLVVTVGAKYHDFPFIHADGRQIQAVSFDCKIDGDQEVVLSVEHQAYKWISADELASIKPMTYRMREMIRKGFKLQHNYV